MARRNCGQGVTAGVSTRSGQCIRSVRSPMVAGRPHRGRAASAVVPLGAGGGKRARRCRGQVDASANPNQQRSIAGPAHVAAREDDAMVCHLDVPAFQLDAAAADGDQPGKGSSHGALPAVRLANSSRPASRHEHECSLLNEQKCSRGRERNCSCLPTCIGTRGPLGFWRWRPSSIANPRGDRDE